MISKIFELPVCMRDDFSHHLNTDCCIRLVSETTSNNLDFDGSTWIVSKDKSPFDRHPLRGFYICISFPHKRTYIPLTCVIDDWREEDGCGEDMYAMTFFDGMGSFALYFFSFSTKWRISMSIRSRVYSMSLRYLFGFFALRWRLNSFASLPFDGFRQCHGADFLEKNFVDVLIVNR
jgi:hypothetical protein